MPTTVPGPDYRLQIPEQVLCLILFHGFLHIQHFNPDFLIAELYHNDIALLHIGRGFCRLPINRHPAGITGLICNSSSFYQS